MKMINNPEMSQINRKTFREKEPHLLEIKGKSFIYDTNNMAIWEVEKEILPHLDKKSICVDSAPFWVNSGEMEHKGYVVFQSTYACNLSCKYCFVKHHYVDHENSMNLRTAIDALKIYQPNWKNEGYKIGFFGGEPLMNWEFIYQLTEWCKEKIEKSNKEKDKKVANTYHITTNATLMTEEMAKYCAENNFSFIVSLDGEEEEHNESRPYANSANNSFKDTMRGLVFLANAYKKLGKQNPITLRSTFDRNGCELVRRLSFLNDLMYKGMAGHVSIEPSCLAESCARNTFENMAKEEILAKFEKQYFDAAEWFLKEIRSGRRPSMHHFEVPLQRIYDREATPCECGAGKGYVSVGPGGKVAACHREHESVVGNFYTGIDQTKLAAWYDNRYFDRIGCNDCWQRNFCGGGCRCNSALLYKNLKQPSWVECLFKDIQARAVIWLMSEMTDNEKKMYSKNGRMNMPMKENIEKVCSDPECKECNDKIKERTAQNEACQKKEKQKPPCGLNFCMQDKCPFSHCGKQTTEEFQAGLQKLNGMQNDKVLPGN